MAMPASPLYPSEWDQRERDLTSVGADGRTLNERLELLKQAASAQFKQGKLTMAVKMYTDAIRIAPKQHTLYSNRSACYAAAKEYVRAFEDATKCIDLMPAWGKGYARKGAALHGLDRWTEAIAAYEAGLRMEPESEVLKQGLEDAKRRLMLAGGVWEFHCNRRVESDHGGSEGFLKAPSAIAEGPGAGGLVILDRPARDTHHNVVRVVNHDGSHVRCTLNAGQETNRDGIFGQAHGVACDGDHVYVTDQSHSRVVKCAMSGDNGNVVGSLGRAATVGGGTGSVFDEPWGLALARPPVAASADPPAVAAAAAAASASATILFVTDAKRHRVVAVDPSRMAVLFTFGEWGAGDGELKQPRGVAVCGERLLVADYGNRRLCLFTLGGDFVRSLGPDGPESRFACPPTHVAAAPDALFAIETSTFGSRDEDDEKTPGRIHVLCPETGERLRPPFHPPFATSHKGEGVLHGIAVMHNRLYVTSGFGVVLSLPRRADSAPDGHGASASASAKSDASGAASSSVA